MSSEAATVKPREVNQNRWPWRFACIHCGSVKVTLGKGGPGQSGPNPQGFQCRNCGRAESKAWDKKQDGRVEVDLDG